jgi:KipI family sensor histidine kinase inhibitor
LSAFPRVLPVGDSAVTVELGDSLDLLLNARVRALDRALQERPFPGFREAVPTHRSLLVLYDPQRSGLAETAALLEERAAAGVDKEPEGRLITIPVLYGGEAGPDLAEVARARGLSEADLIAANSAADYRAFMLGFTPGFAYLGLLPPSLETPRRATPRVRVAAGSVGIAGRQTGVYPVASAGGWNLLGRTSVRLFDPAADPPALILPGDRVRFRPVRELGLTPALAPAAAPEAPALEVLEPGLLTTVQDRGRFGQRRLGVTTAGPMDAPAHRAANRVLGNPGGAAALELTAVGPVLRFLLPTHFAIAGADLGAVLERADLGAWPVPPCFRVLARPGNLLRFRGRRTGCRSYLALSGGIEVPPVLGSRSTDLGAGFGGLGGRALRASDLLAVGRAAPPGNSPTRPPASPSSPFRVRVVLGPQADHLEPASVARFLAEPFTVGPASDRVGCRLQGPKLTHGGPAEILSDGMVTGSIQVPPDGQPIVMMADAPTTGGYPKIGTVITADLPLLAQALPGEGQVRFEAVSVEDAQRALPHL